MKIYRPEIDFLRAISIILVILFHFDYKLFQGGFVGVDVFFVISGYLITNGIVTGLESGHFSYFQFIGKRMKRLLPVYFTVTIVIILLSYFLLIPHQYQEFGKALAASAKISSNKYFLDTSFDYFLNGNFKDNPLLHTWSLSIEEQFYLIFPVILIIFFHLKKTELKKFIYLLSITSFIFSILTFDNKTAYFELLQRSWEILTGCSLFFFSKETQYKPHPKLSDAIFITCLALIIFTSVYFSKTVPFPGHNSIPLVLASATAIFFGAHTSETLKKYLFNRYILSIGLISYSLYLWHYPLAIFRNSLMLDFWGLPNFSRFEVILISLILSTITYHFIEKKMAMMKIHTRLLLPTGICTLALLMTIGNLIGQSEKDRNFALQYFFSENYFEQFPSPENVPNSRWRLEWNKPQGIEARFLGDINSSPSLIIVGDSYAGMWGDAFDDQLKKMNKSAYLLSYAQCAYLYEANSLIKDDCKDLNNLRSNFILGSNIDHVLIANSWKQYYVQYEKKLSLTKNLQKTKEFLKRKVTLVIPPFELVHPLELLLKNDINKSFPLELHRKMIHFQEIKNSNLNFITTDEKLCLNNECKLFVEGKSIYHDIGHLNSFGSHYLVDSLIPYLKSI